MRLAKTTKGRLSTVIVLAFVMGLCAIGCAPHQAAPMASTGSEESSAAEASGESMPETDGDGFAWTADMDCSSCHEDETNSSANADCIASKHAAVDCVTCHSDEAGLTEAHAECYGPLAAVQVFTQVSKDVCVGCHNMDEVAAATADNISCTDKNGLTVNPHDLPVNEDHDTIQCGNCHDMHGTSDTAKNAPIECESCHHAGVYECGTCHG